LNHFYLLDRREVRRMNVQDMILVAARLFYVSLDDFEVGFNPATNKLCCPLERVKGIEPSYSAWKAAALPLSYTRAWAIH
jgi:hypothetical protein